MISFPVLNSTAAAFAAVLFLFCPALFGLWLHMGVTGIAIGMSLDLVLRGALFLLRLCSQKWTRFHLI